MTLYLGVPSPAPRTPERLKIVARLSLLIWVSLVLVFFDFVKAYIASSNVNLMGSILFILLSLALMGLLTWFNWLYCNWLNALVGNTTRVSLGRSADVLRSFLLFCMIIILFAIIASAYALCLLSSHEVVLNGIGSLKILVQIIIYICCDVVTASARTWFRVGYSTLVWKERPRLVVSMWLLFGFGVVQTVLGWIAPFFGGSNAPGAGSVLFAVLALALSGYTTLLMTRLVNSTFGVDAEPPGQSVNESTTLSI